MLHQKKFFIFILSSILSISGLFPASALTTNIVRDYYVDHYENYATFTIKSDRFPNYEIVDFPEKNIITIKIRNASVPKSLAKVDAFESNILDFVTISKIEPNQVWIKLQKKTNDIAHNVFVSNLIEGTLSIKLYPVTSTKGYLANSPDALKKVVLIREVKNEQLAFILNKPANYRLITRSLPDVKLELTLKNTNLEFKPTSLQSEFIKHISYQKQKDDLLVTLSLHTPYVKITSQSLPAPNQVLIKISSQHEGLPIQDSDRRLFFDDEESTNINNKNHDAKYFFIEGESKFRQQNYEGAFSNFKQSYNYTKTEEIGILALFRAADSLHELQKKQKKFDGYQNVIKEYSFAIDRADELGITSYDHARAMLMIGLNHQADNFYEEASEYYAELVNRYPKSYYVQDALYHQAVVSLLKKNYSSTIRQLQDYILRFPYSRYLPLVHYKLGQALYHINRYPDAHKNFVIARSLSDDMPSDDPNILYAEANTYYHQKSYPSFVSRSKKLIEKFPDHILSTIASMDLGDYYFDEAKNEEAIAFYEFITTKKFPEIANMARMKIANISAEDYQIKDYQLALAEYENIFTSSENQNIKEEAILRIIIAHNFHEEGEKSITAIKRYRKLYPEGKYNLNGAIDALLIENITHLMTKSYLNNDYSDIISQYVRFRQTINKSDNQFILWLLADAYSKLNNYRDSSRFYQILLTQDSPSRFGEIRFAIGDNFKLNTIYNEALVYFEEVSLDSPLSLFGNYAKSRIADIYIIKKDYRIAIEVLENLIAQMQNNDDPLYYHLLPASWFKLGLIQKELGLYESAFTSFKEVRDNYRHPLSNPNIPDYVPLSFFYLGDMTYQLKSYQQSLIFYQEAIDKYPKSPQVLQALYFMASIHLTQENYATSLKTFNQILATEQEGDNPFQKLALIGKNEIERNQAYAKYLRGDLSQ
ncbi:MAG: tetratricopeptide repeat protein [SAR324 cluster bacterium]|nr:tetratricopeptide repeat protein [SAR324 cluster bacterium]